MDVDKMFKMPSLPSGAGQKRKSEIPTADTLLKRYKASVADEDESMAPPPVPGVSNGKGKGKASTVADEDEEERQYAQADDQDIYFDPEAEDEDARFFGGGLNTEQKHILDIFDAAGDDGDSGVLTVQQLKKQLVKFEKVVAKNAEQRAKYPNDPSKFIESEADLDSSIKLMLPLTQNPAAFYPELIRAGTLSLLCSLLSHENTDIAIDVVEVIMELTDEDVGAELEDDEDEEDLAGKVRMAITELIDTLLENSILELLVANLSRLNEEEETDRQGIFNILGAFENLLSFLPPLTLQVTEQTSLLPWLLERIQKKPYDSNKQYASEILAILLQNDRDNRLRLDKLQGMDTILRVLSQYRKKDPGDVEEIEFMENVFNCLCSALAEPEMKKLFLEAEGVELMVIMMKEKMLARTRAIKVLDYAMQSEQGSDNCERFVEALGLKTLFSAFMGKGVKKHKVGASSAAEDDEHIVGILVSLFSNLASDTPARIRLLSKFVEADYEKVDRLLEIRESAVNRLKAVTKEITMERRVMQANNEEIGDEEEYEWYVRKTEAGLSLLQNVDYVLAWIAMEDDGAMMHAKKLLERKDLSFKDVVSVLEEFRDNIGDETDEGGEDDGPSVQRLILEQLIAFLDQLV